MGPPDVQAERMHRNMIGHRRMKLECRLIRPKERALHPLHFVPCRAAIWAGNRHMVPSLSPACDNGQAAHGERATARCCGRPIQRVGDGIAGYFPKWPHPRHSMLNGIESSSKEGPRPMRRSTSAGAVPSKPGGMLTCSRVSPPPSSVTSDALTVR